MTMESGMGVAVGSAFTGGNTTCDVGNTEMRVGNGIVVVVATACDVGIAFGSSVRVAARPGVLVGCSVISIGAFSGTPKLHAATRLMMASRASHIRSGGIALIFWRMINLSGNVFYISLIITVPHFLAIRQQPDDKATFTLMLNSEPLAIIMTMLDIEIF
jgi:hypothetical protein